jgi:mono/diheme cytochrome c family protein
MYRGILQDRFYLTQYLADYILGKKLNEGVHMGRIYRITGEGETSNEPFNLQRMDGHDLIQQLSHRNAWRRDTARRLLIERQDKSTIRDLLMLVQTGKTIAIQLNALWTLEGLDALTPFLLSGLLTSPSNKIKSHCILLAKKLDQTEQAVFIAQLVEQKLIETPSYEVAMALSAALGQFQDQLADELLEGLLTRWPNNTTIQSLALSGLYGREQSFIDQVKVTSLKGDLSALITLPEPINAAKTHLNKEDFATYVRGQQVYGTAGCAGCHGEHGEGQNFSGPPLAGSEWVTGSPMRLCAILLHGVTGPMHVADSLYNPGTDMPGLKNNNSVSLAEIAALIAYLRNSWGNRGNLLSIEAAYKVNELTSDQRGPFTEAELIQMFDD